MKFTFKNKFLKNSLSFFPTKMNFLQKTSRKFFNQQANAVKIVRKNNKHIIDDNKRLFEWSFRRRISKRPKCVFNGRRSSAIRRSL